MKTIKLSEQPIVNDDWIKTLRWDFWIAPGQKHRLVETLNDLLIFLDVAGAPEDRQRRAVRELMELPSARPMPDALRSEVMEYLGQ